MFEMVGYIYNGDEYFFYVVYVNIKESFVDMLGLEGIVYVEFIYSYEMGVVKVQDNFWIEVFNDDIVLVYEFGDYWWNQYGMVELKLMMVCFGGFVEWMFFIGVDNLMYYFYFCYSDGMEILYLFFVFKG